jgi:hypothetical protein
MAKAPPTRQEVTDAIRAAAHALGRVPSRPQFLAHSGMTERNVLNHFDSWNEAVKAADLEPYTVNAKIDDTELLADWGQVVRGLRQIPTILRYEREGHFSPSRFFAGVQE